MNSRNRSRILVAVLSACLSGTASDLLAQSPELIVEIEKNEVYEGESVLYRITLNHVENPKAPILNGFEAFEYCSGNPICAQRLFAMKPKYSSNMLAFRPSTPLGIVS